MTTTGWATLNYTVNNLEGPLPFTPKFELKLSGSYKIPRAEVDLGVRYRMHSGRRGVAAGGLSRCTPSSRRRPAA